MPKARTGAEEAAGKLVSAVQKEWSSELGTSTAWTTEHVLSLAHELLQATKTGNLNSTLSSATVSQFLGELWVLRHPTIRPAAQRLESFVVRDQDA